MSIRYGLLALLDSGPKYGYQLRIEFERTTGDTWPLNIGQVYTTLARLERDRLVAGIGADDEGRARYEITDKGRAALEDWFATPVPRQARSRDELTIKLTLALAVPGADVAAIVQNQRTATVRALQDLTRHKRKAGDGEVDADLSWQLAVDASIFQAEAEVRWLDHCESRFTRSESQRRPTR